MDFVVPSLQNICLEALAKLITSPTSIQFDEACKDLPHDLAEKLQQILIQQNCFNDNTILKTTSSKQTSLEIPFSIKKEDETNSTSISSDSITKAIHKCSSFLSSFSCTGHELSKETLVSLTSWPVRIHLSHLSLIGCHLNIEDSMKILVSCPNLQYLNFSGNFEIGDSLLLNLLKVEQSHHFESHHLKYRSFNQDDQMDGCLRQDVSCFVDRSEFNKTNKKQSMPSSYFTRSSKKRKISSSIQTNQLSNNHILNNQLSNIQSSNNQFCSKLNCCGDENEETMKCGGDASKSNNHHKDQSFFDTNIDNQENDLQQGIESMIPAAKRHCSISTEEQQNQENIIHRLSNDNIILPNITCIKLSGCNLTNFGVEILAKLFVNLIELDISHCSLIDDITPIIINCKDLKALNISGCPVKSHSQKLIEHVKNSQKLHATQKNNAQSNNTNNNHHHKRFGFFEKLEILLFCGSGFLDSGFEVWLLAAGPSLQELRLSNKTLPEDPIIVDTEANRMATDENDHLTENVHFMPQSSSVSSSMSSSSSLISQPPDIESILKKTIHLPLFFKMLKTCFALRVLDVHGMNVSSKSALKFFLSRPSMINTCEELDFVHCDEICQETLLQIFGLHKPKLEALLNSNVQRDHCSTQETPLWPRLKTLRFSGGKNAEKIDSRFMRLIGLFGCPQLEHLVINNAHAGKPLLRQREVAEMLSAFCCLKSVEIWCLSSVSFQLASIIPQLCKKIEQILLCVVGSNIEAQTINQHDISNSASFCSFPSSKQFITPDHVHLLQSRFPHIEWKIWRHSIESTRQFQHILPSSKTDSVSILRPYQVTNKLEIKVAPKKDFSKTMSPGNLSTNVEHTQNTQNNENNHKQHLIHPSQLIQAQIIVDGIPIWNTEKSASMHHLSQSIWSLVTRNAGALPFIEDWCCSCNIDEFNGVLFYDDNEYVYWEVSEPGPKYQFKFHKTQYVSAIASAMQQQWSIIANILPKEQLVQQALIFTQQHAWHQKFLDSMNSNDQQQQQQQQDSKQSNQTKQNYKKSNTTLTA